jgi:plasmid stabilization system protein ParE
MKKRRITISDAAVADILEQADWYESQADHELAERWENAVTAALLRILTSPRSGPLCRFNSKELNDVRRAFVKGFPSTWSFTGSTTRSCSFFVLFTVLAIWKACSEICKGMALPQKTHIQTLG